MNAKTKILDDAIGVLQAGGPLTIDSVARAAGLTKPGVVHHFRTKEVLTESVVDRIADRWEAGMAARTPAGSSPVQRLRACVEYALSSSFDQSDLALMADVKLRDQLCRRWVERLDPWFGMGIDGPVRRRARLRAARAIADGAWFNRSLGIPITRPDEDDEVLAIALELLDENEGVNP